MKLWNPATLLLSSPPCQSLVLRFTVVPQGCFCPLKHCHTAILVPTGLRDPAYDVAYQSKMQGKVRGVSSRLWGVKYKIILWSHPSYERRPSRDLAKCPARAMLQLSSFSFPYRDVTFSLLIKLKTLYTWATLFILLDLSTWFVPKHCSFW